MIDITDTVHLAKQLASNINKKVVYLGDYPVLPSIVYAISTNSQLIAPAVASFKDAQSFSHTVLIVKCIKAFMNHIKVYLKLQ